MLALSVSTEYTRIHDVIAPRTLAVEKHSLEWFRGKESVYDRFQSIRIVLIAKNSLARFWHWVRNFVSMGKYNYVDGPEEEKNDIYFYHLLNVIMLVQIRSDNWTFVFKIISASCFKVSWNATPVLSHTIKLSRKTFLSAFDKLHKKFKWCYWQLEVFSTATQRAAKINYHY